MTAFLHEVWRLVARVPRGRVATYGQLAMLLGHPRAARAVGMAMRRCPPELPWHRVVNARGTISRRRNAEGMLTQRIRLQQEGVRIRSGRIPLADHAWRGPRRAMGARGRGRGGRARCDWD